MFSWAKSFGLLVMVALEIIRFLQRRQDYDKAKLEHAATMLRRANELVDKAQSASSSVDESPAAVLSDPENRDNSNG
jgi:hypothetical protein